MNETVPPVPGSSPSPKTSALSIWSLVLGILSLTCFSILTAIPGVICGHMSLSRIKKSAGALEGRGLAIGGLITGYIGVAMAVVVFPLMMLTVIPKKLDEARAAAFQVRVTAEKKTCLNRLRIIDNAKQMWALDNKKKETDIPTTQDLLRYLPSSGMPHCPSGGDYSINAINQFPTCSIPDHKLE